MDKKRCGIKNWRQFLFASAIFLTILIINCRGYGHIQKVLDAENLIANTSQEISENSFSHNYSHTLPEDCFFCGDEQDTVLSLYRGQKNLGIINLNTFELSPIQINQYDDFGKLMEEPVNNSSTHIITSKTDGFFLSLFPNINRGYATGYLSFKRSEGLDMKKAASRLCSHCLTRLVENCLDDTPMGIGVIDFCTGEVRLFEKKLLGFSLGDYYISCNDWSSNDEWQEIDLLVFYCPERYQN